MDAKRRTAVSKFLSRHLRHDPAGLGLTLGPGGWADIGAVLAGAARAGFPITRAELDDVVRTSDKQRFAVDPAAGRMRANQGHSVAVDLGLEPAAPPAELYHGTADRHRGAILRDGLRKMRRHHVHLSADIPTAVAVGRRHGEPLVFAVAAARMAADGHPFWVSANGVWLADAVPPAYLRLVDLPAPTDR